MTAGGIARGCRIGLIALLWLAGNVAVAAEHITVAVWGSPPAEARALDPR